MIFWLTDVYIALLTLQQMLMVHWCVTVYTSVASISDVDGFLLTHILSVKRRRANGYNMQPEFTFVFAVIGHRDHIGDLLCSSEAVKVIIDLNGRQKLHILENKLIIFFICHRGSNGLQFHYPIKASGPMATGKIMQAIDFTVHKARGLCYWILFP